MTHDLVVVGAGGFGRETLDVVSAINAATDSPAFHVIGVIDDSPSEANLRRLGDRDVPHLGSINQQLPRLTGGTAYAVAIGRPDVRATVVDRFDASHMRAATLVHPQAVIGSRAVIDEGSIICGGVQMSTNVLCGRHVHVNPNATIGHDTILEDFVSINPAATISGECTISAGSLIGAAAVVLQGLTVHRQAVVGAAACVVRDVAGAATVKGVPAS